MSTNHTENYNLCQWEKEDQVLRTDFNDDNAKLEAALSDLEQRVTLLDRAVPGLMYYLGQNTLFNALNHQQKTSVRSMQFQGFQYPSTLKLTGGVEVVDQVLTLTGAGKVGTMEDLAWMVGKSDWIQARMMLRKGPFGSVKAWINGNSMTLIRHNYDRSESGKDSYVYEYVWNGKGKSSGQVKLELNCGTSDCVEVYDYVIAFI